MAKKTKAYSYTRFSTPEQSKGDSARRQLAAAEEYARRNDLDLDDQLTFRDLGVSAYRGRNADGGQLGTFKKAVEDGVVPQGSILLVENLDRISRQTARVALRTLEDIVDAGVVVVTLSDGKQYTKKTLDEDQLSLMMAILTFIRAHEESAIKGRRVRAAWDNKRTRAVEHGTPLTKRTPGWLILGANGKLRLDQRRAALVRRVFKMTLSGLGQNAIALAFNREKVPAFNADRWHRTYVKKLLSNPAVVGRLVAHRVEYENGRKVRKPVLEVEDHFPAAITKEDWHRVQEMRDVGSSGSRSRSAPKGQAALQNVLAGLARCPKCAGTMTRINKGPTGGYAYLTCAKAKAGAGCEYRNVGMRNVELTVLGSVGELVGTMPTGNDDLDARWPEVQDGLSDLREQAGRVTDAIAQRGHTGALGDRLASIEEAITEMEAEEAALSAAVEDRPLLSIKVAELTKETAKSVPDRAQVNALLRQMLKGVVVDYPRGKLVFQWKHGGENELTFAMPDRQPDEGPLRKPRKGYRKAAA